MVILRQLISDQDLTVEAAIREAPEATVEDLGLATEAGETGCPETVRTYINSLCPNLLYLLEEIF